MKHAYLILAHKNLSQIQNIIDILDSNLNDFYIHIDLKCKEEYKFNSKFSNIKIIRKENVVWGDYSIVSSEIYLLDIAIKNDNYSYFHLLSGEDLPIKDKNYIYNFFEKSGKEFIYFTNNKMSSKDYDRVKYNHFFIKKLRSSKKKYINSLYFRLNNFGVMLQKIFHCERVLYFDEYQKGAQWFSITSSFAKYVIENKDLIYKAFNKTLIPDELFLQTLVINSKWKNSIYDYTNFDSCIQNMRLIDWNRGNPYIFQKEDFEELINSQYLFARKFSIEKDKEIINQLKKRLVIDNEVTK